MRSTLIRFLIPLAVLATFVPFQAQAQISLTTEQQNMLDLAEELFGSVFKNGTSLRQAQGYIYRLYPDTGTAIGFKDGNVYTYGGIFGNKLKNFGSVSQVTVSLQNYKSKIELDLGGSGIAGDYDLTVSGMISAVVGGQAINPQPFEVVINNIAGPEDPSDLNEIDGILNETLENVDGITDLVVVVTNNTANRITFSVEFTASQTQQGVTVSIYMELEYDFVKN